MIPVARPRLLSVLQPQSRNQIQNHLLGLKSVKSAPNFFTPPDSSPATARRCELGARLPASGLLSFPRPLSFPFLSSSSFSSSVSPLIPRVPSSRVLYTTAKMSNEIVHPTIQGRSAAESNPILTLCAHTPPLWKFLFQLPLHGRVHGWRGMAFGRIGTCFCNSIEYFHLMYKKSTSCTMLVVT